MEKTLKVDVVNAEESLFSGNAEFVALPGIEGELGILPGHTPLITLIRPGLVRIRKSAQDEEEIFVAGGVLEIQPFHVIVLADVAIRSRISTKRKQKKLGKSKGGCKDCCQQKSNWRRSKPKSVCLPNSSASFRESNTNTCISSLKLRSSHGSFGVFSFLLRLKYQRYTQYMENPVILVSTDGSELSEKGNRDRSQAGKKSQYLCSGHNRRQS